MKTIPTEARQELGAAQFVLGPDYVDWAWRERMKASPPVPKASISWPFKRFDADANVIEIKSRKKAK